MIITTYNVINQYLEKTQKRLFSILLIVSDSHNDVLYLLNLRDFEHINEDFNATQVTRTMNILLQGNFSSILFLNSTISYKYYRYDKITNLVYQFKYYKIYCDKKLLRSCKYMEILLYAVASAIILILVFVIICLCVRLCKCCTKQ